MIERTEERFGLKPERLAPDTAYVAAPMLTGWPRGRASRHTSRGRQIEAGRWHLLTVVTFDMTRRATFIIALRVRP
jgi:hypothetical protein